MAGRGDLTPWSTGVAALGRPVPWPRPLPMDGVVIVIAAAFLFVVLVFWIAVSKMLPPTDSWLIEWMREDEYYCFLVPLSLLISLLANYIRWFSESLSLRS